jgi:hypothetical protein
LCALARRHRRSGAAVTAAISTAKVQSTVADQQQQASMAQALCAKLTRHLSGRSPTTLRPIASFAFYIHALGGCSVW